VRRMKTKYKYWDTIIADVGTITRCTAAGEMSAESVCRRYPHPGICPYWHCVDMDCGVFDVCAYPVRVLKVKERKMEKIEIKRDIDAWVVYVNGQVHPRGTGFPTRKVAEEWAQARRLATDFPDTDADADTEEK
jgi:hypothetical protein